MKYIKYLIPLILILTLLPVIPVAAQADGPRYHYLGPWIWSPIGPGGGRWTFPDGTLSVIDLRSIPQMSQKGGAALGRGLFITDIPVTLPGYVLLSQSFDDELTPAISGIIEGAWGISLQAHTSRGTIWEMLVEEGDPTGETRWMPLRPEVDGKLVINLDGYSPVEFWQDVPKRLSPQEKAEKTLARKLAAAGMSWELIELITERAYPRLKRFHQFWPRFWWR